MSDNKKAGADTHKFKMKPKPGSPPGIEVDEHGDTIPFGQRTKDDQDRARAASKKRGEGR